MILKPAKFADARKGCIAVLNCPRGPRDGTAVLRNFAGQDNHVPPPGRYFLHWFPYPHIIARPLEGMRSRPQEELDEYVLSLGSFADHGLFMRLTTPYHALLSIGVRPWFDEKEQAMRYSDMPDWLDFDRITLEGEPGWMEKMVERQKQACRIIRDWGKLSEEPPVRLVSGFCLEIRDQESPFRELLEEDILCFHDEIACQMVFHRDEEASMA